MVVSDYQAVSELIPHGYAATERDAAQKAIAAGVDMEMVSTTYYDNGKSLLATGQLNEKLIDDAVRNILRLKLRLGLFGEKGQLIPSRASSTPEAMKVARQLASQSLVLLKNNSDTLPLSKSIRKNCRNWGCWWIVPKISLGHGLRTA